MHPYDDPCLPDGEGGTEDPARAQADGAGDGYWPVYRFKTSCTVSDLVLMRSAMPHGSTR